ncbi:MAG TPA: hypothetical protein PLD10_16270 [Rhodopila sp.]|nr:hypothetical protein [Rhodopila sp.]
MSKLRFPFYVSPKIDGIRCTVHGNVGMSRTMKPLPNRYLQRLIASHPFVLDGMDGELIVGEPNLPTTYNTTVSAIMSEDGEPDVKFYVFDNFDMPGNDFHTRYHRLVGGNGYEELFQGFVRPWDHDYITHPQQLVAFEARCLTNGFEGVMLRSPSGVYKQGRSTFNEHILLKLKRFEDAEAEIIGFE